MTSKNNDTIINDQKLKISKMKIRTLTRIGLVFIFFTNLIIAQKNDTIKITSTNINSKV